MDTKLNFPDQTRHTPPPTPIVYVKDIPIWEYKQLIRHLEKEKPLTEDEMNKLGTDGWELAGIFNRASMVYFYFKRLVG